MLPIRDDQPRSTTPWVTHSIIAVNISVYAYEWHLQFPDCESLRRSIAYFSGAIAQPPAEYAFNNLIYDFGLIPSHVKVVFGSSHVSLGCVLPTLLTSMFIYGSIFHLLGNLGVLWIFGDNIEDHFGHGLYAAFYLLCGTLASLTYVFVSSVPNEPAIGASGAIAGVTGAFLLRYPTAKVEIAIGYMGFRGTTWIPAFVTLFYWLALQLIGQHRVETGHVPSGGIAY